MKLTDRIGHGTHLVNDPRTGQIPFELCPTSNVINRTVESYETHHFGELFKRNHPLCICTDDKGIFSTTLTEEYLHLAKAFNLTKTDLFKISYAAIDLIFDESMKEGLQFKFNAFNGQNK